MSYLLFVLPILGLIALFGAALRAPQPSGQAESESAFSYASDSN